MTRVLGAVVVVFALWAVPASAHHAYDMDCPQFPSQAAAQYHMNNHPGDPDGLDGNDSDGRACESNPCPCFYGVDLAPPPAPVATPAPSPVPTPAPTAPIAESQPVAERFRARIVRVIDGDTITARLPSGTRKTVRVIGIDTPEARKPGVRVECGANSATRYMGKLAFRKRDGRKVGQNVRLTTDPTQDRIDRYGRLLAYVTRLSDGTDLGGAIVRAGWAMPYVYDASPFERLGSYESAGRQAETRGRGVWAACGGDFHSEQ